MIISINWLKQFTQIDASIEELATVIGARLVEIEGVESIGEKYKDVVIARIAECRPVEDSDHLNLTKIDDGGVVRNIERDENGLVQVVCGAPNVREGLLVAWLPPGSTVPETFGEEPFVLGARKLRGYVSNGMLASARELDLFDDHEGIVEIDKDVAPGTDFMTAYALDDYLLEVENKSLTHRPDTFGIVGFAREVAAIAGSGFATPDWLLDLQTPELTLGEQRDLTVAIDNPELSSRYTAVVLSGLRSDARTPLEIQTYLSRSGIRPISPAVDITNYLMLLTSQPLHAFDYDKVVALTGSSHIHVREGHENETLALLDGRTVTVTPSDIVIAAGDKAIALGGAMGGAETEIDSTTTTIILESATFNLYKLRDTGMRHGIFSEAITRLSKGQPAALTVPVSRHAIRLFDAITGAVPASQIVEDYPVRPDVPTFTVPIAKINDILGTRFSIDDVVETLGNVEFSIAASGESVVVTPPYWRTDIHIDEDIVEEVGRLNGFDAIELRLPTRDFTAVSPAGDQQLRERIQSVLSAAGANQILTYSFIHGDVLRKAGQSVDCAFALANALSPDLQYYRPSLMPSLLAQVNANQRQKFDEFALFELSTTQVKGVMDAVEPSLPAESGRLGLVYAASDKRARGRGSAFYTAKAYLQRVTDALHIGSLAFKRLDAVQATDAVHTPFEPKRSAAVYAGETYVGIVGEYKKTVAAAFKLPAFSAGFELLTDALQALAQPIGTYVPLSRFPGSDADITFKVSSDTTYRQLTDAVQTALADEPLEVTITPGDIYRPDDRTQHITIRLVLVSFERTLTRETVNALVERVGQRVGAELGAAVQSSHDD